jgi:hypothetical protein
MKSAYEVGQIAKKSGLKVLSTIESEDESMDGEVRLEYDMSIQVGFGYYVVCWTSGSGFSKNYHSSPTIHDNPYDAVYEAEMKIQ